MFYAAASRNLLKYKNISVQQRVKNLAEQKNKKLCKISYYFISVVEMQLSFSFSFTVSSHVLNVLHERYTL